MPGTGDMRRMRAREKSPAQVREMPPLSVLTALRLHERPSLFPIPCMEPRHHSISEGLQQPLS